jgi:hypothetical protein
VSYRRAVIVPSPAGHKSDGSASQRTVGIVVVQDIWMLAMPLVALSAMSQRGVHGSQQCGGRPRGWEGQLGSPAGRTGAPTVAAHLLPEDPKPDTESKEPGPKTRPDLRC